MNRLNSWVKGVHCRTIQADIQFHTKRGPQTEPFILFISQLYLNLMQNFSEYYWLKHELAGTFEKKN